MQGHLRRRQLVEEIVNHLWKDATLKSIQLEVEARRDDDDPRPQFAHEWAALRQAFGVTGYATRDDVRGSVLRALDWSESDLM